MSILNQYSSIVTSVLFIINRVVSWFRQNGASPLLACFVTFGVPNYIGFFALHFFQYESIQFETQENVFILLALSWSWIGTAFIWYAFNIVTKRFTLKLKRITNDNNITEHKFIEIANRGNISLILWVITVCVVYIQSSSYIFHKCGFDTYTHPLYLISIFVVAVHAILTGVGFRGVYAVLYLTQHICKNNTLHLNPYDSDGLGGLSIFGYLTIRTTLLFSSGAMFVPILLSIAQYLGSWYSLGVYLLVFLFTIFILMSFVVPNYHVYTWAKHERDSKLNNLGTELYRLSDVLLEDNPDQKELSKFNNLRQYHNDFSKIHLFPFNIRIITGLSSSVLFPILMLLLQIYLENFLI